MLKKHFLLLLLMITLSALGLRLYQIGQVPHGMTWDEAAIGYNGWSVATVHRDEWLKFMPISFKSFGDYKAPFAIYLNGLFTLVLGLKLWVIRLPFVLAGGLAVWGMALMTRQFLLLFIDQKFWQKKSLLSVEALALLASFALAISPWHFHFSRVGFESGLALTQIIWALYFFFKAVISYKLRSKLEKNPRSISFFLLSSILFALSIYTYHSTKLFTPLLVGFLILIGWRWFKLGWRYLVLFLVSFGFWLLPFFYDVLFGHGLERAGVTLFSQVDGVGNQLKLLGFNFIHQLLPSFLLFGKVDTLRHGGLPFYVLLPGTFLVIIVGLLFWLILRFKQIKYRQLDRAYLFAGFIVLVGLLPAVIGMIVPHPNRALLSLLGFLLLMILGWMSFGLWFDLRNFQKKYLAVIFGAWLFIQVGFFAYDVFYYFHTYAKTSAESFNDGYIQMMNEVIKYEKGLDNYPEVEKIIITSEYGQPYIYALIARKTSPIDYHGGSLIKYRFPDVVNIDALSEKNALVVAGKQADLIDKTRADKIIYNSAGEGVFWLFKTN